ncbi:hypothetical protein EG68_09700 [Paragonimus skrjabini miyazakii]|uniref:Ras-GEF domain-containing protein n=1 Tax=Paragonimus skrjabini miyazakii TaxID=59628 RepID=A0A8S9YB15_9TREM|nr:hypothetical protein EG68_09700 [Paragonimus skrjabini miyazakii]
MDNIKNSRCYRPLPPEDDDVTGLTYDVAIADITKAGPDAFAITLIELSLFKAIKRDEFSSLKWNGKEKHLYAPNIVASTRWFNQINFWVQKEILKYSQLHKRTELLSFFIKIAKKLVDHNNLYSAMSIISALQVECIYRLRHTWNGLNNKDRATYRRLEELFSQEDNCRRQREFINSISIPGIPYLGLYLSDLTYTNVAHPRVGGKPTAIWFSKINAIIDTIAFFQKSEYPFTLDGTINAYLCSQRYIEELQKFLEEENYQASLHSEPPAQIPYEPQLPICSSLVSNDHNASKIKSFSNGTSKDTQGFSLGSNAVCPNNMNVLGNEIDNTRSVLPPKDMSDLKSAGHLDVNELHFSALPHCTSTPTLESKKKYNTNEVHNFSSRAIQSDISVYSKPSVSDASCNIPNTDSSPSYNKLHNSSQKWNYHQYHLDHWHVHSQSLSHGTKTQSVLPPVPPRPQCDADGALHVKRLCLPPDSNEADSVQKDSHKCTVSTEIRSDPFICENTFFSSFASCPIGSGVVIQENHNADGAFAPPTGSLDATAAAVCAAVIAKDVNSLPACLGGGRPDKEISDVSTVPVVNSACKSPANGTGVVCQLCSALTQSTQPLCRPVDNTQFGVRIMYQGVVERRTMVQQSNKLSSLAALFSPKLRKSSSTVYDSSSFLSASTNEDSSSKCSVINARSLGFSAWRRLWATLVMDYMGSAAFMIYFEAKSKNATSRHDFSAHHCQIQSLINSCSVQLNLSESHLFDGENKISCQKPHQSHPTLETCKLSVSGDASLSPSSIPVSGLVRTLRRTSISGPSSPNVLARVEIGRHQDGTVDPNSFLLSDPTSLKAYRFRPVLDQFDGALTEAAGAFNWLRRTGLHSPRVAPRTSEITPPDLSRIPSSPFSCASLGRPRGFSAPGIFSSNFRSTNLKTTSEPGENDASHKSSSNSVAEWIRSIQLVLERLEHYYKHQFAYKPAT